jgi:hypothetical protein
MPEHAHTCCRCGYTWVCLQGVVQKCPVTVAQRVNHDGPYCELCRHLEMAQRHAQLRGITLTVTRSDDAGA